MGRQGKEGRGGAKREEDREVGGWIRERDGVQEVSHTGGGGRGRRGRG